MLKEARELEYSIPFDQEIKTLTAKYKGDPGLMKKYLSDKGYDIRTREEKLLDRFKEKGYCKEIKNPESMNQIIDSAIRKLTEDFRNKDLECKDFNSYVSKALGEDLSKIITIRNERDQKRNK
jgi:hypothetical protein